MQTLTEADEGRSYLPRQYLVEVDCVCLRPDGGRLDDRLHRLRYHDLAYLRVMHAPKVSSQNYRLNLWHLVTRTPPHEEPAAPASEEVHEDLKLVQRHHSSQL